ncbi:MAG: zinc ribbon domain-containing protein [Betaproteobacteria bacterium]|nr:zinc ribbon domain-containing protein [Betaproteobacteria bacterium]MCL2886751.1 zinc ribbon domain-containing protein [Betaproteobacteria bacterium]
MNCSQCGNPIAVTAKFCNHCGAARQAAPTPQVDADEKSCAHCHALCKPQAKFCPQCGNTFPPAAPALADAPLADAPLAAAPLAAAPPVIAAPAADPRSTPDAAASAVATPPLDYAQQGTVSNSRAGAAGGQPWIKWALIAALLIVVCLGGLFLARKPDQSASPTDTAPSGNAISQQDKEQGKAEQDKTPVAAATPEQPPSALPSESASEPAPPASRPAQPNPPPQNRPKPTLNDLLD